MKMQRNRITGSASPLGAVVASICIILYIVAVASAAVRIFISIDQRRGIAEREFAHIANVASFAGFEGFTAGPFVQTMNDLLMASATIDALIVSGPEGASAFERQLSRSVRWIGNSPQFIRRFDHSSQNLFLPLGIPGVHGANIQGVSVALDYGQISSILRQTLVIIMGSLALAFFTLLMEYLLARQPAGAAPKRGSFFPDSSHSSHRRSFAERRRAPRFHSAPEAEIQPPPRESDANVEPAAAEKPGLYSPKSNIAREEFVAEKLEYELHRCASSELDLILVAMEFKNISDEGFLKMFAGDAAVFFGGRDALYEKGQNGIYAITPSANLEKGIAQAEQFHKQIAERYSHALSGGDFFIGITSRRERLVTAERMMLEADEALRRAKAENAPILAFKSDPDKYRAFIKKEAKKK